MNEILLDNTAVSGTRDKAVLERVKKLNGKTFSQAAPLWFTMNNGNPKKYGVSDLRYDLDKREMMLLCVRLVIFLGIVQPGEIRRAEHEHERQEMQHLVTLLGVQSFLVGVEPGRVVLKVKKTLVPERNGDPSGFTASYAAFKLAASSDTRKAR